VLALIAAGRSDLGTSKTHVVTERQVEFHTRNIFRKPDLPTGETDNRRVHAALTFLRTLAPHSGDIVIARRAFGRGHPALSCV
jgi:hypothetical protein